MRKSDDIARVSECDDLSPTIFEHLGQPKNATCNLIDVPDVVTFAEQVLRRFQFAGLHLLGGIAASQGC
jgi:hypothetical protein